MIRAVLDRQLMISVNNNVGMLAAVTSVITSTGINLLANCAYAIGDRAAFMFVTDDNNSAKKLLESHNINVQEEEVILLSVDNKPASATTIGFDKLNFLLNFSSTGIKV